MGSSYLVTGARLRCMRGREPGRLIIPEGCYTADGRPKATETDCKKEINISDFGECKLSEDGKTCKECMELTDVGKFHCQYRQHKQKNGVSSRNGECGKIFRKVFINLPVMCLSLYNKFAT